MSVSAAGASDGEAGFELRGERQSVRRLVVDVWRSRELISMLARQDFHVRYRRASLGVLWAIGLPLLQATVLAVVFTKVVRISKIAHYPTFMFAGVLPWTYLAAVVVSASTAIVDGQALATKIYFPRAVLPLVTAGSTLYGFAPSVGVLIAYALLFGGRLGVSLVLLLPALVLMVALTAAISLTLSALQVYFRDVRYIVSAIVLVWFYVTPVIYPLTLAHGAMRLLLYLNPATGMIELFRASVVGADPHWLLTVAVASGWTLLFLAAALELHRRFDRVFVDLL